MGPVTIEDGWSDSHDPIADLSRGLTAENLVDEYGLTREEMDAFAAASHQKAAAAQKNGWFDEEITPVTVPGGRKKPDVVFDKDESIRYEVDAEKMSKLPPAFKKDGSVTAGNACGLTDGAAFLVAMTREQAEEAILVGARVAGELIAQGHDLLIPGEMGIGNTTPSAALAAAFTGRPPAQVTGRGTGLDDGQLANKIKVIERALEVNKPDPADGLDVLAKVGGFEIGGIAGVVLGCAALNKPVLVDGFISTAGAMLACSLAPDAGDYVIAAHRSMERGHRLMQEHLGLAPLLDLNLRLGEGTGAALAMPIVESAARVLTEMATFEEAAVAQANP